MSIAELVNNIIGLYTWIVIVRIFLTWIPSVDWNAQPFKFLAIVSDVLLNPFRRVVPSVSGLDFSPVIALLFLQFLQYAVVRLLLIFGL